MHNLRRVIKQVNKTHKGLGPMVAANTLAMKANKCILNIAPAGCGKSKACDAVQSLWPDRIQRRDSITRAGLRWLQQALSHTADHVVIDDLGAEKSLWSLVSTISTFAQLTYSHDISKYTMTLKIEVEDFHGSAALNLQPVLMQAVVEDRDWVANIRDKVFRYYHLIRPSKPYRETPKVELAWGPPLHEVRLPKYRGKMYWQLFYYGLVEWSAARASEHIEDYLKASAALDGRRKVNVTDYHLLKRVLACMLLERYMIESVTFESGRRFNENAYYILVELASFKEPSMEQIAIDYHVSPSTAERLVAQVQKWAWIKTNSPRRVLPTDYAKNVLDQIGVYYKW